MTEVAATGFPDTERARPLWLITLADLSLLLLGFLVLVQALQGHARDALIDGVRRGFGAPAPAPAPMAVAAAGMLAFAPGPAALPGSPAGLLAWARDMTRDGRVTLTVTGSVDGTPADVDRATGSAAVLAADRARAVAAALAPGLPGHRLTVTTSPTPGRRAAVVTLAFAGAPR